jgi:toxin ParE1/3/4
LSASYLIKPKADADLDQYADYLRDNVGLSTALRFFDASHRPFALLAAHPTIGWRARIRFPRIEGLRVFPITDFSHMRVVCRATIQRVDILRVIHGSRNVQSLLRREGFG